MSRSFGLLPVGGSGTTGSVTVVNRNGLFIATVAVYGIASGSLHTVHIHFGSCMNAYGGMHLTVLGLMAGDASNSGGLGAAIAPVYLSSGHYVIVYATSSPQRIIACANLGAV
jgi:hypothetical protein